MQSLKPIWVYCKPRAERRSHRATTCSVHEEWTPYVQSQVAEVIHQLGGIVQRPPDEAGATADAQARSWDRANQHAHQHVVGLALCRAFSQVADVWVSLDRNAVELDDFWFACCGKSNALMLFKIERVVAFARPVRVHAESQTLQPRGTFFDITHPSVQSLMDAETIAGGTCAEVLQEWSNQYALADADLPQKLGIAIPMAHAFLVVARSWSWYALPILPPRHLAGLGFGLATSLFPPDLIPTPDEVCYYGDEEVDLDMQRNTNLSPGQLQDVADDLRHFAAGKQPDRERLHKHIVWLQTFRRSLITHTAQRCSKVSDR